MRRLRIDDLTYCINPEEAVCQLGPNLARYLLNPSARHQVNLDDPVFHPEPGSVPCLFAFGEELIRNGTQCADVLSPGFILPFVWRESTQDSDRLPPGIRGVARSVADLLGVANYGLHLPDIFDRIDLSDLTITAESIWVSLASGLLVTSRQGRSRPDVFATGSWVCDRSGSGCAGLVAVRGIVEKTGRIMELCKGANGSAEKAIFFVPRENAAEVRELSRGCLDVRELPVGEPDWEIVLQEIMQELFVQPGKEVDLDRRIEYANSFWMRRDTPRRCGYYLESIVADLSERIAVGLSARCSIDRFVVMISKRYELSVLMASIVAAKRVMFIHTNETACHVGTVRQFFPEGRFHLMAENGEENLVRTVSEFLEEAGDGAARAVDITSGTKVMALAIVVAAEQARARVLYLDHSFGADNQVDFGRERVREIEWVWNSRLNPEVQEIGGSVESAKGEVTWSVRKEAEYTVAHFSIPGGLIEPGVLAGTDFPVELLGRRDKGLVISGKGPVWLYAHLVHLAHVFAWVALYDPRLAGGIVVMNHSVRGPRIGSVVPVTTPEQTGRA